MQPGDPRLSRRPAPLPRAQAPRACRGRRPDLPRRGLAPSPRWAPLGRSGCSARASRDCPEGGWRGGRAAAAGRGPLYGAGGRWEGGAGESGPPHSCARRAPVGAGAGAPPPPGPPPGKGCGSLGAQPLRPDRRRRGRRRSLPHLSGPAQGAAPPHPSRLRSRVPGCLWPGVASWLPTHLRTQGGEQPRCPDGHRPCAWLSSGAGARAGPRMPEPDLSFPGSVRPHPPPRVSRGRSSKDCLPECPQARHLNLLDV